MRPAARRAEGLAIRAASFYLVATMTRNQFAELDAHNSIFEADLPEEQYGYRRGRSAHDAIRTIHGLLNQGHREVVDCDLSGYFDSIPHHELMKSVV